MDFVIKKKWLLLLLIVISLSCERGSERARIEIESDSLVSFIEKRIEEKKRYEEFRRKTLPRDFEKKVENYYPVIRKYSKRYGFDWRLIVMQIVKESSFREDARSRVGAMGLMQIMPSTALEIRREMDIEYIANNPRENITAGIYHLYKQVLKFPDASRDDRVKLALAAYNCGIGRIYDARSVARYLKLNPQSWESVRECLPMLTAKHWQLHLEIWELGVPNYGYFYGYEETINYVDDIIESYQIFTSIHQDY
jgi:membrane-bound lytic murein transglycosylase F